MTSSKKEAEVDKEKSPKTDKILNKAIKSKKKINIFIKPNYVPYSKKANVKKEPNVILPMV